MERILKYIKLDEKSRTPEEQKYMDDFDKAIQISIAMKEDRERGVTLGPVVNIGGDGRKGKYTLDDIEGSYGIDVPEEDRLEDKFY